MNASYINKITNEFIGMPYKSILINGAWGIGKSYEITKAIEGNDNFCYVSLFGLKDSKELYHELFIKLISNNSKNEFLLDKGNKVLSGVLTFFGKERLLDIITDNELVEAKLCSLANAGKKIIIVFDDLERISTNFKIEELFGTIEKLRSYPVVKTIIVANINEMTIENKAILYKYSEKIIDKIYVIEELSNNIRWEEMNIDRGFINELIQKHKIKNVRTLKKAQNFYEDVKFHIEIQNEKFLDEIRDICYAIVLEDVDELYKELPEAYKKDEKGLEFYNVIYSDFVHRTTIRYLNHIVSRENLVQYIYEYYQSKCDINKDIIATYYKSFKDAGEKANFYKSDDELKSLMPILYNKFDESVTIAEIVSSADTLIIWMEVLEQSTKEVLDSFNQKITNAFKMAIMGGETYFPTDVSHIESSKLRDLYVKKCENAKSDMVIYYIDEIYDNIIKNNFDITYKLTLKFRESLPLSNHETIKGSIPKLLIEEIFSIGSVEVRQYNISLIIIKIMKEHIYDLLIDYTSILKEKYKENKMFNHRLKYLLGIKE